MQKSILSLSIPFLLLLGGCGAPTEREPELVIVNVLESKYHDDCDIKDSINVPFDSLMDYAAKNWDKEKTHIVLYCGNYACTSSGAGARQLKKDGYKHVWAYEGGTAEWLHKGLPISGPCQSSFLQNYEEPEGYEARAKEDADIIITTEQLQKKIDEFATN